MSLFIGMPFTWRLSRKLQAISWSRTGGSGHQIGHATAQLAHVIVGIAAHIDQLSLAFFGIGAVEDGAHSVTLGCLQLHHLGVGKALTITANATHTGATLAAVGIEEVGQRKRNVRRGQQTGSIAFFRFDYPTIVARHHLISYTVGSSQRRVVYLVGIVRARHIRSNNPDQRKHTRDDKET